MSRNGSGTYNLPAGNPVVTNTIISSTWANNTLSDIANALTGSLAADGQTTATGNLNLGNNKITNLADGTASSDGVNYGQLLATAGAGAIRQAIVVTRTAASSTNAPFNAITSTGHSATIVPTSSTSKILVICSSSCYVFGGGGQTTGVFSIYRGATNLSGAGTSKFTIESGYDTTGSTGSVHMTFLDSPATTSSTTYTVYYGVTGGGSVEYNPSLFASLILLEIGA
jgi:hypothetical protein